MKSSTKTTTLFTIALAFTVAAVGVYVFFFIAMKNKTQETAALLSTVEELSGKESRIASAVTTLKNENDHIQKLSSYFIKESEIVSFTKTVEALGPQSGTALVIESLEPGLTEKSVPYLNFRVRATGKFSDVMRLLVLLENFPGKFEWKTVRLVRAEALVQQSGTSAPKTNIASDWNVEVSLTALNFVKE